MGLGAALILGLGLGLGLPGGEEVTEPATDPLLIETQNGFIKGRVSWTASFLKFKNRETSLLSPDKV